MKKRILSLLLALVTVFYIIPFGAFPVIALDGDDEEKTTLTLEDLEVGKLYKAEFVAEEFTPWARFPFINTYDDNEQHHIPNITSFPTKLTVVRESESDLGLVYVSGYDNKIDETHTIEWPDSCAEYRYIEAYYLLIGEEGNYISIDDMIIGEPYDATWNWDLTMTSGAQNSGVIPYRRLDSEVDAFIEYGFYDGDDEYVETAGFPKDLIVELVYDGDTLVRVTNKDWPAEYEQYRYVDPEWDINVLGEYNPTDDGYIYGKVDIFCEGAVDNVLRLERGKKVQAFTELGSGISANARFQWEMKIEGDEWAIVKDAILSYITISEALVANTVGEYATLRCIVTDGTQKYASEELKVKIQPEMTVHYGGANGAQQFAGGLSNQPATAADSSVFQACINYKFVHTREDINGTNAFAPFIHTFYSNSDTLSATIYSQLRVGYTACVVDPDGDIEYNGVTYTAKPLHKFDGVSINSPKNELNITIYYVPNWVGFTVEYHEQNLADDSYTRAGQVRKEGYTDDFIGTGLDVPRVGFKALFYDPELTIAGNGATVVEIYYDRIYYLVKFDTQDGHGITPYYVRYDTQVMLTEPTKPGYSFKNPWILTSVYDIIEDSEGKKTEKDLTITDEMRSWYGGKNAGAIITVRNNIKYTATWTVGSTSFTIVYWREDADSTDPGNKENYSVWATETINAVPDQEVNCTGFKISSTLATTVIDGKNTDESPYFTRADAMSDESIVVKGDGSSAANIYYTRNTYHIWFSGGTEVTGTCGLYEHEHGTDCNLPLLCQKPVHQHSTDICGERVLICEVTEHALHTVACCIRDEHTVHEAKCCTKTEHTAHDNSCCTKTPHANHTTSCFSNISNTTPANPSRAPANAVDGQIYKTGNTRYIYINGSWYRYSGTDNNGTVKNPNSSCPGIHTHGDGKCTYSDALHEHFDGNCTWKDELHTHGDGLCTCTLSLHTHGDNCYKYPNCGVVSSHDHTDACYGECDKYEHDHSNSCNTSGTNRYIYAISAKYNSNIAELWPTADKLDELKTLNNLTYNGKLYAWNNIVTNSSGQNTPLATKRVNMTSDLCDTNDNKKEGTADISNTTSYKDVYYLFESFDQTSAANGNLRRAYGNPSTYYDSDDDYYQRIYGLGSSLSAKAITGMKAVTSSAQTGDNNAFVVYYTRNRHDIVFTSVGTSIYTVSDVMYEYPISSLSYTENANVTVGKWSFKDKNGNTVEMDIPIPNTPSIYEEGSVYFAGWYTTPMCADGTEYNFATATLPDENVYLYAKWQPTEYKVQVYRQESEIGSTITGQLLYDAVLPFNTQVREEDLAKYVIPQENYVFSGWYYVVGGEEKRYDFNTMLIKGETVIYAKWTKNIQIPYTVLYLFNEGTVESPEWVEIADRTEGYSLAGISKTFTAKMGIKLYEKYQSWYFPASRYYTHVMSEDFSANVIRFEYQSDTEIEYTILHKFKSEQLKNQYGKYFPDGTFQLVIPDSIKASENNFTTTVIERYNDEVNYARVEEALKNWKDANIDPNDYEGIFNILASMTADYYVQEMVLTLEPTQNVMVFNWFESNTTKTYHIIHYLQAPDRSTYSVYSSVNHTVQNDSNYEINEEWDNPFGYVRKEVKISGVAKGEFLNQDQVNITLGQFGQDATIEFYYDRAQYTYTIHHYINGTSIRIADDQTGTAYYEDKVRVGDVDINDVVGYIIANPNDVKEITAADQEIICFYNSMSVYYLFQEAISGRGIISKPTYEGHVGILPEQDEAMITATPRDGYRFIGWYLDKAGIQSVEQYANVYGEGGASIMPKTPTPDMANQTITFYALFEPTTRVFENEGVADESQAFIYRIEGLDGGNSAVDVTFVITGNGSVTLAMLPYGNYRITVLNWAWRYGLPNGMVENSVEVNINTAEPFTFVYSGTPTDKWLTDDASGTVTP